MTIPTSLRRQSLTDDDVLLRRDLLSRGWRDDDIAAAVRTRSLVRIRYGTYAYATLWDQLDEVGRHLLRLRGLLRRLGDGYAASHHSACLAHGVTLWGVGLTPLHVTRLDGTHSRRQAGVVIHVGRTLADDPVTVDGLLATPVTRAVLESAALSSPESSVVAMSTALTAGATTREELRHHHLARDRWPGMRPVRRAIEIADDGCTSVGEARAMYLFDRLGIERPLTQVEVRMPDGTVRFLDFYWHACRHVAEFDGHGKYVTLPVGVEASARTVVAEKQREDQLRGLGLGMTRFEWSELDGPRARTFAARLRADLDRSRRLYVPGSSLELVDRRLVVVRDLAG